MQLSVSGLVLLTCQPMGVAVYAAQFSGDQSLAARLALSSLVQLPSFQALGTTQNPISRCYPNHAAPHCRTNHLIGSHTSSAAKSEPESKLKPKKPSLICTQQTTDLPHLIEASYPFKLSSGELVSFSHSKDRILIALATSHHQKLGVDTELKPISQRLVERFFSASEQQIINSPHLETSDRQRLRQTAWMIKEAHGKAAGLDLLTAIAFDLNAVLLNVLQHLDQTPSSAQDNWIAQFGEFTFMGNLQSHWALCLS